MTKNTARNWFFIGTFACMVLFFILTVHTMSTIPEYTNSENLSQDVIAGKKAWEKHNCIGCHTLIGEGAYYAPELKDVYSQKGPAFITAFLKDPVRVWYGSAEEARGKRKMPNLHLSDDEVRQLVAFFEWVDKIDTHHWPPRPGQAVAQAAESPVAAIGAVAREAEGDEESTVREGEAIIKAKGCTACHRIKGVGQTVGPDLTGVTERVDLEILRKRLKDPKLVNPDSIMPGYGFTEDEIEALITYLKTL